jgi:hypothetical protein
LICSGTYALGQNQTASTCSKIRTRAATFICGSLGARFNDLAESPTCHRCGQTNALINFRQLHIVSGVGRCHNVKAFFQHRAGSLSPFSALRQSATRGEGAKRIGWLSTTGEQDLQDQAQRRAFHQEFAKLGWTDGQNFPRVWPIRPRATGHGKVRMIYRFRAGASRIGRVKSRAHMIKCSTIGLRFRFFSVTMLTGHSPVPH